MTNDELTHKVIGFAIEIHKKLGPGLYENVYKDCLIYKMEKAGLKVEKEKTISINFDGLILERGFRVDILVEEKIVLELKSVKTLNDIHLTQMITYLKLGKFPLGLILNFDVPMMKEGIKRVINSY